MTTSIDLLTTRRLRLRIWRRSDIVRYDKHCNTPEVMAWLGGVMTPHQLRLEYEYFRRQHRHNGFTFWVMERKFDNALIGFCGIVRVDEPLSTVLGEVEIGWRVRSDMWRRGYAFEAACKVLEVAFGMLAIPQIVSRVAPCNIPSQGLMRKLSMTRYRRRDYIDPADHTPLLVYRLRKIQWDQREER